MLQAAVSARALKFDERTIGSKTTAKLDVRPVTAAVVRGKVHGRLMEFDVDHSTAIRVIQNEVCAATGVCMREMWSTFADHRIVRARHVAMMLARHYPSSSAMSYPQIGRAFKRDHTTVISAVQKLEAVIDVVKANLSADNKLTEWVAMSLAEYDRLIGPRIEAAKNASRKVLKRIRAGGRG